MLSGLPCYSRSGFFSHCVNWFSLMLLVIVILPLVLSGMLFSSGGFSVPESLNHFYILLCLWLCSNNICWHSLVSISIATIITLMLNYLQQSIYIFLSAIYYSVNMICFKVKKQFSQYLIVTTLSTNLTSNFTMTDVTFYTMGLFKLFHTLFYTSIGLV